MQKKILFNLFTVSLCGIILCTVALFVFQTLAARNMVNRLSESRLNLVEERIYENNQKIEELLEITREDNLGRARALAMMIEMEPGIINDTDRLEEIADALDADEMHIIDENGILRWGTQPAKYGMDFAAGEQTRPFLAILDDPAIEISQAPMPNASRGVVRQYAGVSLRNMKGIAEVGVIPSRLLEALENASIGNVLRGIPVGNDGYMFAVDAATGLISSHPDSNMIGIHLPEILRDSGLFNIGGQNMLCHMRDIQGQLVVTAFPVTEMYEERAFSTSFFLVFMMSLFSTLCNIVHFYIKKHVITGIRGFMGALGEITAGQLDKNIDIRSCEEFSELSDGINHMLFSINTKISVIEAMTDDKKRLAAAMAIADAGIIIKDKDGVVIEWNTGAENILGYKSEEMIGHTTHKYAPESSYDELGDIEMLLSTGESIVRADVVREHKNGTLVDCSASYTPIFDEQGNVTGSVAVFHDISGKKKMELDLMRAVLEAEEKNQIIMSGMDYANKIQKNLLPSNTAFEEAFSDYAVIWSPRDIVGGDIYWIRNFTEGTVLCVCDCTGHGTPGALLTMLVASTFESAVSEKNYKDTAGIIWRLEQKLVNVFHRDRTPRENGRREISDIRDGCDLAVLYISNDGSITISAGNIHVFICDGKEVIQIRGQRIYVGEGELKSKDDVRTVTISANPDNKFYIATDGLFDQIGGELERPFGYGTFKRIILENHNQKQTVITKKIWDEFESYRGEQPRRDDCELVAFKPRLV